MAMAMEMAGVGRRASQLLAAICLLSVFAVRAAEGKVCTNAFAGKMHAMLQLLGHYDDATLDFAARSTAGSDWSGRGLLSLDPFLETEFSHSEFDLPLAAGSEKKHLEEFLLSDVTLSAESPQARAQQTNLEYLLLLDADNLLYSFRITAGLEAPGQPYGGWEAPECELRGHFVGHYLSACAQMWASTRNATLQAKMQYFVRSLAECQDKIGSGYLSAFPTELFDRFENLQPVWAPYYTIHKVMAGLLDQYTYAGDHLALTVVSRMADYFRKRVESVIRRFTINRHYDSLNEEVGGMNDVLYRLYQVTGKAEHLELAHLFDKPCFLGPLALETNQLQGLHANTHIPLVIGAQSRYEVLGDDKYKDMSAFFLHMVQHSHMYSTGGTSAWEFWQDPHRLGDTLQQENQESCTTYNLLKVARNLFRYTREASYADYYERAMANGVLGIQRGTEPGRMIYMLPLGTGVSKAKGWHGWGGPFDAFWCCYGTGVESFSKLGDSIYFRDTAAERPTLYVIQFVPSRLHWPEAGLNVTQSTPEPTANNPQVVATFEFASSSPPPSPSADPPTPPGTALRSAVASRGSTSRLSRALAAAGEEREVTVAVRVPSWADRELSKVELDGVEMPLSEPGSFFNLTRSWKAGDKLQFTFPLKLRVEQILDDRPQFANLSAILLGPYMLAGMTSGERRLSSTVDASDVSSWVHPVPTGHRHQLHSLQLAGPLVPSPAAPAAVPLFLRHHNGRVYLAPEAVEGSDEAAASTFRLTSPVGKEAHPAAAASNRRLLSQSTDSSSVNDHTVSLELFDRPGQYLLHNGAGYPVSIVDRARSAMSGDEFNPFAAFQQVPGLMGPGTVSLESRNLPRHFLSCFGSALEPGNGTPLVLQPILEGDIAFAACSSFIVGEPKSTYHPMSFTAKGHSRDFLLYPISTFKDESYTAYFQRK